MKKLIISIGDIHGSQKWKQIDVSKYDHVVFIGDYVDSNTLSDQEIFENLKEIVELKKLYPDKIILLLGNHDIIYLLGHIKNSGYRPSMWLQLNEFFTENKNLFQLAFQIDNFLWTHAGVHTGWYQTQILNKKYVMRKNGTVIEGLDIDKSGNVADILNFCFESNHQPIFDCGLSRGGKQKVGGPFWCDFQESYKKPLIGYHQIVGHTPQNEIKHYSNYKDKNTSMTYIDCLGEKKINKYKKTVINNDNIFYILEI